MTRRGRKLSLASAADGLRRWASVPWPRWLERAVVVGILAWAVPRLAPQVGAAVGWGAAADEAPTPDFAVTTLDGEVVVSDDLRGRVVVVNFWATWCPPCRVEMPGLQRLWERERGAGVVVLGISTDVGRDGPIRDFLDERGIDFPVARADRDVRRAFGGVPGLPTTFILDREGRVRHRVVGYFAPVALRPAVERLLREPAGSASGDR